jgi:tRNA pseudouridine38-40 synthase
MPRYCSKVEYDGSRYHGFQKQKKQITVQEVVEKALCRFTGYRVVVAAAGRTDRGVHAVGQVISFDLDREYAPKVIERAINHYLPSAVRVYAVKRIAEEFNARYAARSRTYIYNIVSGPDLPLWLRANVLWVPYRLNVSAMRKAARNLLGKQDFRSLCCSGSAQKSFIRTIMQIRVKVSPVARYLGVSSKSNSRLISITVKADGFLYKMVRSIVGTLLEAGKGKIKPSDIKKILEGKNRALAGRTVEAKGLCFVGVEY